MLKIHKSMNTDLEAANQDDDAHTQFNLGLMYSRGDVVPQDYALAALWFRKAADRGYADAQSHLGFMYMYGIGVPQDYVLAAEWCRKAADQGDVEAQFNLGLMYTAGLGVPQDNVLAAQWYLKAANQGSAVAQTFLAWLYEEGRGVPQDYPMAAQLLRNAADQGTAVAQNRLGELYEKGSGVPQNLALAAQWYRKAADQGNADAQYNLGVMYANGLGVPQDDAFAAQLFREAANQGHADAQFRLGVQHENGQYESQGASPAQTDSNATDLVRPVAQVTLNELDGRDQEATKNYEPAVLWYLHAIPAIGLIAAAILPVGNIGNYTLLRFVVFISAAVLGFQAHEKNERLLALLFACAGIIFNPFLPFSFARSQWQSIDVVTGLLFLFQPARTALRNRRQGGLPPSS